MNFHPVCVRCGELIHETWTSRNGLPYHQRGLERCRWRPWRYRRVVAETQRLMAIRDAERDLELPTWEFGR